MDRNESRVPRGTMAQSRSGRTQQKQLPVEGRAAFQVWVQPQLRSVGRKALVCSGLWNMG